MKKAASLLLSSAALAMAASVASAGVTDPNFGYIGQIKTRTTQEIKAAGLTSPFGIGGETTDRGYSTFSNWKDYLGPLGAQKLRVQTGWHYVESVITTPATYDFAKLDTIVDGALAQGVKPWLFLGYGNERAGCTNCGSMNLGGALPSGTGKDRFLDFVRATVNHFNSPSVRVSEWEIWNEPDGHVDVDEYKVFIVDVAKAIKSVQPSAKITIGSFTAGVNGDPNSTGYIFAKTAVDYFAANKGPTVPSSDVTVSFHPYWNSPDYDSYPSEATKFNTLKGMVEGNGFKLRQGENGAPSTQCSSFAFCDGSVWTENDQARYILRRMIGDFALGMDTNIFTITDLHYDFTKNTKGLLETGTWDANNDSPYLNGDQTVKRKKLAYSAYQNMTAFLDNRLQVITNHGCTVPYGYKVQAFTRNDSGVIRNMLAVWNKINAFPNTNGTTPITITCTGFHFERLSNASLLPRYVDPLDGRVYSTTTAVITGNDAATNKVTLKNIPVGDNPVFIADQGIVLFQ